MSPEQTAQAEKVLELDTIIRDHTDLLEDDYLLRERMQQLLTAMKTKNASVEKQQQCLNAILELIEEDAEEHQREDCESPLDVKPIYRKSTPYFELKRQLLAFKGTFGYPEPAE